MLKNWRLKLSARTWIGILLVGFLGIVFWPKIAECDLPIKTVTAQTQNSSMSASRGEEIILDPLLQAEQEQALKLEYQNILATYIEAENDFKETRNRYRRFSEEALEPILVEEARTTYQLRDRALVNYLNWVTELIKHYADNGEVIEQTQSLNLNFEIEILPKSNLATASDSTIASVAATRNMIATTATELTASNASNPIDQTAMTANEARELAKQQNAQAVLTGGGKSRTQKQVFLDDLEMLSQELQEHYAATNTIQSMESWLAFNETYGDKIIEKLKNKLYPIFSYTLLSQVKDLNSELTQVWKIAEQEVNEQLADEPLIRAEKNKVFNQLETAITRTTSQVEELEEIWVDTTTAGAYDSFREKTRGLLTETTQILTALQMLYVTNQK